ncbi:TNT domain-containing protein [Enterobacter ludwigii]|uniref:TNT domain-containing protein n=1 Tax=Enterobacter TaxID=547 RepID=UPI00163A3E5E|nr:TNT domain-containing protein [Enterobacter ludwigii]ELQ7824321.1 TNT domain-containing protein [Enterobacter ludwigii]MBK1517722.1 TNT domain-containing protein [Enterobacter ludwigii]HDR2529678.1 TNT domain-containing protein [Enterobacter ludwigii]
MNGMVSNPNQKVFFKTRTDASKAYKLWKNQDWQSLESFMGLGAWPPNRGLTKATPITLKPGTKIDRYGGRINDGTFSDTGTFVSPAGASFESRALPLDTLDKTYKTYEVVAPVHAYAGPAIPWFEQPGGGTQYELSKSIKQLLADKKIREK